MQSKLPLISVIVPVYNRANFISEAIASIRRQRYPSVEIIVVDDGSTDRTSEVVATLGDDILYIFQSNSGAAAARNKGLKLATGEFIAFLDSDDFWSDDKLEIQSSYLINDSSLQVVYGKIQHLLLKSSSGSTETLYLPLSIPSHSVSLGVGLYRQTVFDLIGDLDPNLRQSEDTDFWLRVRESGIKTITIDRTVYYYRLHTDNTIKNEKDRKKSLIQTLKKGIDQRKTI